MKILTSKTPPSIKEMTEVLKQEFSDRYSYKLFSFGKEKSIIVGKTTFIGAQISRSGNEITIEGVWPSIPAILLSFFLQLSTGFSTESRSQWTKFEKEIGLFLTRKYN